METKSRSVCERRLRRGRKLTSKYDFVGPTARRPDAHFALTLDQSTNLFEVTTRSHFSHSRRVHWLTFKHCAARPAWGFCLCVRLVFREDYWELYDSATTTVQLENMTAVEGCCSAYRVHCGWSESCNRHRKNVKKGSYLPNETN